MENQEVSNNQAAPEVTGQVEQATEQNASVSGAEGAVNNGIPAQNVTPAQPEFDPRKSYETLEKSYKELQRFSTQTAQERAELRKQLQSLEQSHKQLSTSLTSALQPQVDPQQFIEDLNKLGPKALEKYFAEREAAIENKFKETYGSQVEQIQAQYNQMMIEREIDRRKADAVNYPGFADLEPIMEQMARDENMALDLTRNPSQVLDALYKLARASHSDTAIQQAEKFGRQQAEAGLAKEAKTSVAGGGKGSGNAIDPKKMTSVQLKNHFQSLGMVE
jgi:phage-related protein